GTGLETGGALPEGGGAAEDSRLRGLGEGGTEPSRAAAADVVGRRVGGSGGIDEGDDLPSCGLRRVGACDGIDAEIADGIDAGVGASATPPSLGNSCLRIYAMFAPELSNPNCRAISVSSAATSWPRCGRSSGFGDRRRAASIASRSGT